MLTPDNNLTLHGYRRNPDYFQPRAVRDVEEESGRGKTTKKTSSKHGRGGPARKDATSEEEESSSSEEDETPEEDARVLGEEVPEGQWMRLHDEYGVTLWVFTKGSDSKPTSIEKVYRQAFKDGGSALWMDVTTGTFSERDPRRRRR